MWLRVFAVLLALSCVAGTVASEQAGRVVTYRERSLYRNIMVVEGGGYRCITFGRINGEQSCIQINQPERLVVNYTKGLFAAFFAIERPRKVLVVGLGGGVVPRAIRKVYPDMQIDAVELDPSVVKVAKDLFGYVEDAKLRSYVGDGRVFVRKQRRAGVKYDVILMDAMEKDYIPEHMMTKEFMGEVADILASDGIVAANTFADGPLQQYEAATYGSVFGKIYAIDLEGGNRIIIAGRGGVPSEQSMRERAVLMRTSLSRLGVLPDDLLKTLRSETSGMGVRPLTDQYSPSNLLMRYAPVLKQGM